MVTQTRRTADTVHAGDKEGLGTSVERLDLGLVDGVIQGLTHLQIVAHDGQTVVVHLAVAAVGIDPDVHRFFRVDDFGAGGFDLIYHCAIGLNQVGSPGTQRRDPGGNLRHQPEGYLLEGVGPLI